MNNVYLYGREGVGCYDVDWPDDCLAEPGETETGPLGKPKDRTAAERQRRYRERKRNGSHVTEERNNLTDESDSASGPTE
jgi:hypothetical protein